MNGHRFFIAPPTPPTRASDPRATTMANDDRSAANLQLFNIAAGYPVILDGRSPEDSTRALLDQGADPDAIHARGRSLPYICCIAGSASLLEIYAARGANLNIADVDGETPAHRAARQGEIECLMVLKSHGARLDLPDRFGTTPLARAARNAHLHCLDLLLEAHAYEPAALADLAALGWPNPISKPAAEIIRKHLSQRFPHDPELAERARFRPPPPAPASSAADFELLSAASSTRPDAADKADKALARGARPDAYDDNRMSAVHWASSQGKSELLRKLLELGANPGLADEDGNTPAHYAAANAHIDCLRALIEREAPMGQLDNKGEYPITLCVAGAVPKGHEPGWRNALQYSVTSESYNPGTAPAFEECFELLASPENLGSIDIDAFRAAPSLSKINPDERERRVALCERAQILEALRDDRDSVHDEPARATSHRL